MAQPGSRVLPQTADGAALEREARLVARRVVAGRATEPEHWVFLLRLERASADEVGMLWLPVLQRLPPPNEIDIQLTEIKAEILSSMKIK